MNPSWSRLNPTLRGLLLIALVAGLVVVLNGYTALSVASILLRVAFFLAVAFFIYLVWRERRGEIATWGRRAYLAFYGGALLIAADFGTFFWRTPAGLNALCFVLVLAFSAFSIVRIWIDQHRY